MPGARAPESGRESAQGRQYKAPCGGGSSTAFRTRSRSSARRVAKPREPAPALVVRCEFLQPLIADAKQACLLEVGLRNSPPATQILECQILKQTDERRASLGT